MVDLRYHVASLIAIFLALTVGIVVGSSLGSSERQTAAVQHLQQQFTAVMAEDQRIREANGRLRRRLEGREEVVRQLAPLAVRDRLAGQRVAIVLCGGGRHDYFPLLREMLATARAEVISTTRVPSPFGPMSPAIRARMVAALSTDGDTETPELMALTAVGEALATGTGFRRLQELASASGIDLEGEYRLPARRLLLLCAAPAGGEPIVEARPGAQEVSGGKPFEAAAIASLMARVGAAAGATVVVGEPEEMAPIKELRGLSGQGISTVDNVDGVAGQIAAVLALAGAQGDFGTKSAAGRALPSLEAAP